MSEELHWANRLIAMQTEPAEELAAEIIAKHVRDTYGSPSHRKFDDATNCKNVKDLVSVYWWCQDLIADILYVINTPLEKWFWYAWETAMKETKLQERTKTKEVTD